MRQSKELKSMAHQSTSKALQIRIVVPRVHRTYVPPEKSDDAPADSNNNDSNDNMKNDLRASTRLSAKDNFEIDENNVSTVAIASALSDDDDFTLSSTHGIAGNADDNAGGSYDIDDNEETTEVVDVAAKTVRSGVTTSETNDTKRHLHPKKSMIRKFQESRDEQMRSVNDDTDHTANDDSTIDDSSGIKTSQDTNNRKGNDVGSGPTTDSSTEKKSNDSLVGYTEGSNEFDPVEDVVTSKEMETVVKLDPIPDNSSINDNQQTVENSRSTAEDIRTDNYDIVPENKIKSVNTDVTKICKHAVAKTAAVVNDVAKVANIEENNLLTRLQDVASEDVKKEETTRTNVTTSTTNTTKTTATPNTEVQLEKLIRITINTLLTEGHLLTRPNIIPNCIKPSMSTDVMSDDDDNEWIEISVMAKSESIGLVLDRLERIGVGTNVGSVSIYKAELCRTAFDCPEIKIENKDISGDNDEENNSRHSRKGKKKKNIQITEYKEKIDAARIEWMNAASRLRVEQVKEQIAEQASFTFDFLALLCIASILAGIGLITDNTVVIIASMLVSPIMGPVMGITFGSRVRDYSLMKSSAIVETAALLICILVGITIGLSASWTETAETWPTDEMAIRGDVRGLYTGIAIALPSGMGVALSILGNNTGSLVGVAISASLLPPAVNAGVCWAYGFLLDVGGAIHPDETSREFYYMGGISLALTVVNVLCIWISGILMFAIKEVAPTKSKSAFWSRDIKVARKVNTSGEEDVDVDIIRSGIGAALQQRKQQQNKVNNRHRGRHGDQNRKKFFIPKYKSNKGIRFDLAVNNPSVAQGFPGDVNNRNNSFNVESIFLERELMAENSDSGRDNTDLPQESSNIRPFLGFDGEDEYDTDDYYGWTYNEYVGLEEMANLLQFSTPGYDDNNESESFHHGNDNTPPAGQTPGNGRRASNFANMFGWSS